MLMREGRSHGSSMADEQLTLQVQDLQAGGTCRIKPTLGSLRGRRWCTPDLCTVVRAGAVTPPTLC